MYCVDEFKQNWKPCVIVFVLRTSFKEASLSGREELINNQMFLDYLNSQKTSQKYNIWAFCEIDGEAKHKHFIESFDQTVGCNVPPSRTYTLLT